jgi:hypothetical protein
MKIKHYIGLLNMQNFRICSPYFIWAVRNSNTHREKHWPTFSPKVVIPSSTFVPHHIHRLKSNSQQYDRHL